MNGLFYNLLEPWENFLLPIWRFTEVGKPFNKSIYYTATSMKMLPYEKNESGGVPGVA